MQLPFAIPNIVCYNMFLFTQTAERVMTHELDVIAKIDGSTLVLKGQLFGKVEYDLTEWVDSDDLPELTCDVVVDGDPRYPTLVLSTRVGFSLSPRTGKLERCCICCAHSSRDCVCGAWDNVDDYYNDDEY